VNCFHQCSHGHELHEADFDFSTEDDDGYHEDLIRQSAEKDVHLRPSCLQIRISIHNEPAMRSVPTSMSNVMIVMVVGAM
jgi:hypothetical protein